MRAIGIDIGTTSICGVVLDVDSGAVVKSITQNSNAFLRGCADWEKIQSVEKIIANAEDILESLTADEDIAAIGVTGQMHGILYVNSDGEAVSPLYTWQDERGNLPYKDTTYAKHLNSFAGYGNVTDFYNREKGIRPKNAKYFCTIHDYFVMKICGMKTPLVHSSDAASFGCYDVKSNKFECEFGGETVSDYHIVGEYKGVPVAVAIGDNQASVFSTLANDEDVLINVGTGSQVSVVSAKIPEGENIEVRPYFDGKYLVVGAALCGGRAYSMLKDFYSDILGYVKNVDERIVYSVMDKMLQDNENTSLKVDTRFAGTRRNADICGSVTNITTGNFNPSALTYGFLAGMTNELYDMYSEMNVQKSGIVGSGNGIQKNMTLVKMFEEKFGAEMKIPIHTEEASCGAALFSLVSCGIFESSAELRNIIKYTKTGDCYDG